MFAGTAIGGLRLPGDHTATGTDLASPIVTLRQAFPLAHQLFTLDLTLSAFCLPHSRDLASPGGLRFCQPTLLDDTILEKLCSSITSSTDSLLMYETHTACCGAVFCSRHQAPRGPILITSLIHHWT